VSSLCENPLYHIDGDPVHPRNLSRCHPVLHPGADARKLRARDLRRYPVLGVDWPVVFLVTNRRGRQRLQHTRFVFGLADCESASNRDPPRFQSICLNRRLESWLGGVPIGADRDAAMRANKQAESAT
jgi:hypothetical protein